MRIILALTGSAMLLTACGQSSSAPVKRQPGSWSQKIAIAELSGPGITPETKAQMQQMMDMMSGVTVCVSPELAASEDIEKNLTNMGGKQANCTVGKKNISGSTISFTAECKDASGKTARITADGTSAPTEQNIKMTVESIDDAKNGGKLVMNITAKRDGECKPGERTPPLPAATPAKS